MNWDYLFNRHKFFRRMSLIWALVLISWGTWVVFTDPPEIGGGTAAAYATLVGLLATVIAFYQWHRKSDDESGQ